MLKMCLILVDNSSVKMYTLTNNITPLILGAYRRIEYQRIEGMHREPSFAVQRKNYHSSGFKNIEGGSLPNVKQWMINRYFEIEKDWATVYKRNWDWIIDNLENLYYLIIDTKTSRPLYLQAVTINVHFANVFPEKAVILRSNILSPSHCILI